MKNIPIRVTVISLFLILASLLVAVLLSIQFYFGEKIVTKATTDKFNSLAFQVEDRIKQFNTFNSSIVYLSSTQSLSREKNIDLFIKILKKNKNLYSAYVGYEDDRFLEIINLDIDSSLREKYNAKEDDNWLLIEIEKGKQHRTLLDNTLKETHTEILPTEYKVTSRTWYKLAKQNNGEVVKTKPYDFSNIESKGVTFAKVIDNATSVFSVDVLLTDLSIVLNKNNFFDSMRSFIVSREKEITASSSSLYDKGLFQKIFQEKNLSLVYSPEYFQQDYNNKTYLVSIIPINLKEYLLTYVDTKEILEPYNRTMNWTLLIVFIAFLLCLPLVWYFASIIVKPILQLTNESEKVKNRDFRDLNYIQSSVLELSKLSKSMKTMAISIEDYQSNLEKKVEERTNELNEYKNHLEEKVKEEVAKREEKERLLFQQSKLAAMGEMIDAVAHQWKQPISHISLRTEVIQMDFEDGIVNKTYIDEYVDKIKQQIRHMVSTLDEFRSFFRPNKQSQEFLVRDMVEKVLLLVKDEFLKHRITINVVCKDNFTILGVENEFKHLILNIINNAKDAFNEKEIKDRVIDIEISTKDDTHLIEITDNAGGIPENIIGDIFKANVTTKEEGKGTGIGLYMSSQIAQKHNGKLSVANVVGGARFSFTQKILQ